MAARNAEQALPSTDERWASVDSYLICISECDLNDGRCMTRCLEVHLKEEEPAAGL
jgi:hypothetical protein